MLVLQTEAQLALPWYLLIFLVTFLYSLKCVLCQVLSVALKSAWLTSGQLVIGGRFPSMQYSQ